MTAPTSAGDARPAGLLRPQPVGARHVVSCHESVQLSGRWEMVGLAPDAATHPAKLAACMAAAREAWTPISGAMTVGAALRELGRLSLEGPPDLDASDWWIRCAFVSAPHQYDGSTWLAFDGLATLVDVWLNGTHLGRGDDMFVAWDAEVGRLLQAENELVLCARALRPLLAPRRPRARWKSRLLDSQEWRWLRTSQLGRMAGAGPRVAPVGPWRPIRLERRGALDVATLTVSPTRAGTRSTLAVDATVRCDTPPSRATLMCGHERAALRVDASADGWRLHGALRSDAFDAWWPHTHGAPALYDAAIAVEIGSARVDIALAPVGFRELTIDTSDGAFDIRLNGVRPFLRGSCWTPRDWIAIDPTPAELEREMALLVAAGINCVRLSGCFCYPSGAFLDACARHGILVWQDLMFSVLDYPDTDDDFRATCEREITQQLTRLQGSPCVLAVCGNGEVEQQAAMMGQPLGAPRHALFHERAAEIAAAALPATLYWPSTPWGGAVPFRVRSGTSHYFGVGAYRRPLDDARRAAPRFITECLAFAHLPEPESRASLALESQPRGDRERWKAHVPRDGGASWDFEDIRDHYVTLLFGEDAARLRAECPDRYLALGRAVSAIVIERTLHEWRRIDSPCGGALTWLWSDPRPGAGWGSIDGEGRPKSAWYALRRASRPIAIALTNEGLDGVDVHVWNDGPNVLKGTLQVRLLRAGADVAEAARIPLTVDARGAATLSVEALLGRFVDVAHAYRFGAPGHDTIHAVWVHDGAPSDAPVHDAGTFEGLPIIAESTLLVHGDVLSMVDSGLEARVTTVLPNGDVDVAVVARRLAQHVRIGCTSHVADDSYFTLVPGVERVVRLARVGDEPAGEIVVEALNDETRRRLAPPAGESTRASTGASIAARTLVGSAS